MMTPSDANLVEAARSGDRDAFAAIYDRHAPAIHGFCVNRLRNGADAADATQDTFLRASERLDQLRDPTRLRAWLFAIARNDCNRRLTLRSRTDTDEAFDTMASDGPAPEVEAARSELAELIHDVAAGLTDRDQELLWLHLHQGLEGEELAAVLDVEPSHAYVMMSRLRDRLGKALGSLLVARLGRDDCDELAALLGGWDGSFSMDVRSRVTRHVESCDTCRDRRAVLVAPGSLLGIVPLVPPPAFVRENVLAGSADPVTHLHHDPWGWRDDGFPIGVVAARRRRGLWWVAAVAALVVAVAVIAVAVVSGSNDDLAAGPGVELGGAVAGPSSTVTSTTALPPTTTSTSTTTTTSIVGQPISPAMPTTTGVAAPAPEAPPSVAPPPLDSTTTSPPPAPPPPVTPPPTTTVAPPAGPVLSLDTTTLDLGGTATTGTVTVANGGDQALTWDAGVSGAAWSAAPTTGILQPGQSVSVSVSVSRGALPEGAVPSGQVSFTSDGGAVSVTLLASVEVAPGVSILAAPSFLPCGLTGTVLATVADDSALASVVVTWPNGSATMTMVGIEWSATIGPPVGAAPPSGVVRVTATDVRGNVGFAEQPIVVASC